MFDFIFKKSYKINTVSICGLNSTECSQFDSNELSVVYFHKSFSNDSSRLLSFNRDLNLIFTNISFKKNKGTEVLYFKDDKTSLILAKKFKKRFIDSIISEIDNEYPSLNEYKKLKIKLIINLKSQENIKDNLEKFLGDI